MHHTKTSEAADDAFVPVVVGEVVQELPIVRREPSEDTCSVCLGPYQERAVTACGHSFCASCITAVLRTNHPENQAPCPCCRQPVVLCDLMSATGAQLFPSITVPAAAIVAKVGGAWFGDNRYIPRADGSRLDDGRGMTPEIWHVSNVCWFDCGAKASVSTPGDFDVAFRVKRLPGLHGFSNIILVLNGSDVRRVSLERELPSNRWHLLHVGRVSAITLRPRDAFHVEASMRSANQGGWKGGLLIDCMVVLPAGQTIVPPLTHMESGRWRVEWASGMTENITLRHGRFTVFNINYQLRDTTPLSFTWNGGVAFGRRAVVQTLLSYDGTTIVWTTDSPDYPHITWERITGLEDGDAGCMCVLQ